MKNVLRLSLIWLIHLNALAITPFEDTMAQRTRACTACHGDEGRAGPDGYYPRIAGKPAGYLYNQLRNLRDGQRHYALMQGLLEPLSDAYLLEIAQYFAALRVPYALPNPPVAPAAVLARGKTLATLGDTTKKIPSCQQCHGRSLTGTLPNVPGLLGLPRDYLNAQLGSWRTHQRRAAAPDCMATVAAAMSDEDVFAVSHWLAAQPLPADPVARPSSPSSLRGISTLQCGSAALPAPPVNSSAALTDQARHGAYLARAGNCAACHTAPGGAAYAGHRAIETPYGAVYSSNLTSDKATGLGKWSADDFWQAMHYGRSKDGRFLNPAFPYARFTQITRADSDALWAFFQTLPAINQPNKPQGLRWPFGTQPALWAWRTLYFRPQSFQPDTSQSADWNRGAYLVNGLGHCAECHSPRNLLQAVSSSQHLTGAMLTQYNWYAPALHPPAGVKTSPESLQQAVQLLKTGVARHGQASGPMAQVVQGSTQYLQDVDLQAMAHYLQTMNAAQALLSLPRTTITGLKRTNPRHDRSAQLYEKHCADCHGAKGEGVSGAYPALAGNYALNLPNSVNLIQTLLYGGFAPVTQGNPRPHGMPPFVLQLSDQDNADLLTYIRGAWGNQGAPVNVQEVIKVRDSRRH